MSDQRDKIDAVAELARRGTLVDQDRETGLEFATHGVPTSKQLMYEEQATAALGKLTEKQRRRVIQRAEGATLAAIAEREGVSVPTVADSLKAPAVRAAIILAGSAFTARNGKGDDVDLVSRLIGNLFDIAERATRPVVLGGEFGGQRIEKVPDYRTRLDATTRLLSLVGDATPNIAAPPTVVEVERTQTTTTERMKATKPP